MRTGEKINNGKRILIASLAVVLLLGCVAVVWRGRTEERPPGDTVATEPSSGAETSGTSPSDALETEPSSGDITQEPSSEQTLPEDPTQEGTEPSASMPVTVEPTDPTVTTDPPPDQTEKDKLSVDKFAKFSGRFVEDGSDKPIEDVAAILVTNRSERFLDIGTIGYTIDGKKGTFIVTGLPPGASCWVMEYTGLTVTDDADIQYLGCDTSFRSDVKAQVQEVTIRSDEEHLFATNETEQTLESVFIYYKNVHTDGNFFGGITYMVEFGDLEPGQTADKIGGHFAPDGSQIVRIGWQEGSTEEAS